MNCAVCLIFFFSMDFSLCVVYEFDGVTRRFRGHGANENHVSFAHGGKYITAIHGNSEGNRLLENRLFQKQFDGGDEIHPQIVEKLLRLLLVSKSILIFVLIVGIFSCPFVPIMPIVHIKSICL